MTGLPNYIAADNPFKLAGPPAYWLRALWEFDSSLVVMPSKQSFCYRVCQRRPPSFSVQMTNDILKEDADARMMAAQHVIPVTSLLSTANWSEFPKHMEALRQRAPWRMGGAQHVTDSLEQAEWVEEQKRKQQFEQDVLNPLSKDAWNLYNKKLGLRSHMYSPTTKTNRPAQAAPKVGVAKAPPAGVKVGSIFIS